MQSQMIIYKVTNKINGKVYIGQTRRTLSKRKEEHIAEAEDLYPFKSYFHWALKEHGVDNFEWEVIYNCKNISKLNEKEKYYIQFYKSSNPDYGYNVTKGGHNLYISTEERVLSTTKINRLLKNWLKGTVATQNWLEEHSIYRQLIGVYERSGWIRRIGRGAIIQEGDKIDWSGGLYAIQTQLKRTIHAGGKTALQLQGYAHFVPLGKGGVVSLFGMPNEKLPSWFRNYDWGVNIRYSMTKLFANAGKLGLTDKKIGEYSIKVSAPERAMMELLYHVPNKESFEESMLLMEGLTTLRPRLVQELLEKCQPIKVKRLFLLMAEASNHPWVNHVDLTNVDLGRGKRVVIKGGKFNPKYQITVPYI